TGITFKQQNTTTDGEGVLSEVIPSTVQSGIVRVPDAKLEIELEFGLAPLNASEELAIVGAKQRLKATGFYQGEIDKEDGIAFHKAVENFQRFCVRNKDKGDDSITDPGDINAELSDKTKEALIKYYGC